MKNVGKKIITFYQGNQLIKQEVINIVIDNDKLKDRIEVLKDTPPQKKRGQNIKSK